MNLHSIRLVFQVVLSMLMVVSIGHSPTEAVTVWFTSPELRVVANDLAEFISGKTSAEIPVELSGVDPAFKKGDWVLSDIIKSPPRVVEESLSRDNRAYLQTNGQESFVVVNASGIHHLVGGGQRGAIYASVRYQKLWEESGSPPLAVEFESIHGVPAFKERLAGAGGPHPAGDYSQPKPADYDWESYARDLAHHGINLTPGVIEGQIVPDEVLRPWGIRKVLSLSSNPFSQSELRKWRATQPDDVKAGENPRYPGQATPAWMLCPSSDFGQKKYKEWLTRTLADHKTTSLVVFFFADWGEIPGAECAPGSERWQRICSFLELAGKVLKEVAPQVGILLSTRGLTVEDLQQPLPQGVGLYFEEPSRSLLDSSATGYDPSFVAREWDPTYGALLEKVLREKPHLVYPVAAVGDTDRTVSPAIGMAFPNTTYAKVKRLLDLKAQYIALDMGGLHPWVYSPNAEVFAEMMWSPSSAAEEIITRIAKRDFGEVSEKLVEIWSLFDQAIALYPALSRAQRLENMVQDGGDLILRPPTPSQIKTSSWSKEVEAAVPYLLESLPAVIDGWREGLRRLQEIPMESGGVTAKYLRDSTFWGGFYTQLLVTQYNTIRALNLMHWIPEGADPESAPWREAFVPLYRDELRNCEGWQNLLFTAPEPLLRVEKDAANATALNRKLDQKRQALERLVGN